MPRNRVMYVGVLVLSASALLYLGGVLIKLIEWILPWTAGAGVLLILIGIWMEAQKSRKPKPVETASSQQNESSTGD